ncbi:MAG: YoaK family protein [Terrimicrobiaceae bacterium]
MAASGFPSGNYRPTMEAFLLAGVGGCIDAIGLLTLGGLFVSHMSGNTAAMGAFLGQGHWSAGWPHLFAVPVFVMGLFAGYLVLADTPSYQRCAWVLLSEALLLAVFSLILLWTGSPAINTPAYFLLASLPLLAMGMQNATLRQVGRSVFPSTYVTGVLDMLARSAAEFWKERGRSGAAAKRTTAIGAAGIWTCYALGAMGGAAGLLVFRLGIMVLPVVILVSLAWRFFRITDQPRS